MMIGFHVLRLGFFLLTLGAALLLLRQMKALARILSSILRDEIENLDNRKAMRSALIGHLKSKGIHAVFQFVNQ